MLSKEYYKLLIKNKEIDVPLFYKPWWLDAISDNNWDVRFTLDKEQVVGVMPFCTKRKFIFDKSYVPHFTPYLGPYLFYPDHLSAYEKRSFEKKHISSLLSQLPALDDIRMKLHWQQDNWLPYYWHGYKQTTYYTYVLELGIDSDFIYQNLKDSLKRQIFKAESLVSIEEVDDYLPVAHLFRKSLARQGSKEKIEDEVFSKIHQAAKENNAGKIWVAKNEKGVIIAGLYLLFDENTAYYLYGGYEETEAQKGAMSLLFWKAIEFSCSVSKYFDFEGSRIEGVERFFRSFGGTLKPCHFIWKTSSPTLKLLLSLK